MRYPSYCWGMIISSGGELFIPQVGDAPLSDKPPQLTFLTKFTAHAKALDMRNCCRSLYRRSKAFVSTEHEEVPHSVPCCCQYKLYIVNKDQSLNGSH